MTRVLLMASVVVSGAVAAQQTPAPAAQRLVAIVPFGKVERPLLDEVAKAIRARVNAETRIEAPRALPKAAFYPPRSRWRAEKLLDALDADPPAGAWKVIAVTEAEISTTKAEIQDWGIAGLGNLGGRSCVLTVYLYRKHSKAPSDIRRRLADLAVHEFGHTLGLYHCPMVGCVMRDAKGKAIKSADTSTGQYCGQCRSLVEQGVLLPAAPLSAPAVPDGGRAGAAPP